MLDFFRRLFQSFLHLIHPAVSIGGLHISDRALHYIVPSKERSTVFSVRLAPGIIEDGSVKDRAGFIEALDRLRREIRGDHSRVQVIVTLETGRVYTELLTLPTLTPQALSSALDLNLRASSPFPIERVYYDAESIGTSTSGSPEFLGAYVDRNLIDVLHAALEEAKFVVIAIEFAGLSLARTCAKLGDFNPQDSLLVLGVMDDGIDFLIVRHQHLYFHEWLPWRDLHVDLRSRTVDAHAFEDAVTHAITRILNFYSRQWGGSLTHVVFIAAHLESQLKSVAQKLNLTPIVFTPTQFADVAFSSPVVLGAALRGLISRANDQFISLAAVGTERGFLRDSLTHFLTFWRYTIVSALALLFLIFLLADGILSRVDLRDRTEYAASPVSGDAPSAQELARRARLFNTQLEFVREVQERDVTLAPLLKKVHDLAGSFVVLRRVTFDAQHKSGVIVGRASSEFSAINFKNNLGRNIEFFDLDLPFAQIVPDADGVTFQLTFNFRTTSS